MYKRSDYKRYEVSEASEASDCDEKKFEKNFYKFYTEQNRMRSATSSDKSSTNPLNRQASGNAFLDRKKIGNAYSERNVKKPSSTRAKRKLKEELKSKKDYLNCKDSELFRKKSQNDDFFSSEVSTFIENVLHRETFDFNYEELNFLEEKLVDETKKAQLNLKIEGSDENVIRKTFPITNQTSEITIFEDEKFVLNDFLDMIWPRFNELLNQSEADKAKLVQIKECKLKNVTPEKKLSLKSVLPESSNLEPDIIPKLLLINIPANKKKSCDSGFDQNNSCEPNLKKALQKNVSKIQFAEFEKDLVLGEGDDKTKIRNSSTPFKKIEKPNLLQEKIIVHENWNFRKYFIVSSILQVTLCVVTVICLKMPDVFFPST